jgi:RimJ/RimL family protein N-acetyltransferase
VEQKMSRAIIDEERGRCLSPLEHSDLDKIRNWRNSQMKILRQTLPLTDLTQDKWYHTISFSDNQAIFALVEKKDGKFCLFGYCGLVNINLTSRHAELSFIVDPRRVSDETLYRQDFESALTMLCRFGFSELNLHRIYTETYAFREDHLRILESFGFQREGILRQHYFANDSFHDSIINAILYEEWKKIKEK